MDGLQLSVEHFGVISLFTVAARSHGKQSTNAEVKRTGFAQSKQKKKGGWGGGGACASFMWERTCALHRQSEVAFCSTVFKEKVRNELCTSKPQHSKPFSHLISICSQGSGLVLVEI